MSCCEHQGTHHSRLHIYTLGHHLSHRLVKTHDSSFHNTFCWVTPRFLALAPIRMCYTTDWPLSIVSSLSIPYHTSGGDFAEGRGPCDWNGSSESSLRSQACPTLAYTNGRPPTPQNGTTHLWESSSFHRTCWKNTKQQLRENSLLLLLWGSIESASSDFGRRRHGVANQQGGGAAFTKGFDSQPLTWEGTWEGKVTPTT